MAATDALAYIDKTIDNVIEVPDTLWRSDEVVEMLRELRSFIAPDPAGPHLKVEVTPLEDGNEELGGWVVAGTTDEALARRLIVQYIAREYDELDGRELVAGLEELVAESGRFRWRQSHDDEDYLELVPAKPRGPGFTGIRFGGISS